MEIERLHEFTCLARTLNYHIAASQCYIAQSTLSKHIVSLEKELGCKLFMRSKAEVRLTPYGETLFEHVEDVLSSYEKCLGALDKMKTNDASNLSIGYLFEASHALLTEFYRLFHDMHPECRMALRRLSPTLLKECLDEDNLNFVIDMDIGYDDPQVYSKYPLYTDSYCLIVPESHPFTQCSVVPLAKLSGERIIIPLENSCESHTSFIQRALGPKLLKKLEILSILSDPTEIPWYVNNGAGIGLAAGHTFNGMNATGLVCVPVDEPLLDFDVSIIWKTPNETAALHDAIKMFKKMAHAEDFKCKLPKSATRHRR